MKNRYSILVLFLLLCIGKGFSQDNARMTRIGISFGFDYLISNNLGRVYHFKNFGILANHQLNGKLEVGFSLAYSQRDFSESRDNLRTAHDIINGSTSRYISMVSEKVLFADSHIKYCVLDTKINILVGVGPSLMLPVSVDADRVILSSDGHVENFKNEGFVKAIFGVNLMLEARYELGPKLLSGLSLTIRNYHRPNYIRYGFPEIYSRNLSIYPCMSIFYKL